MNFDKAVELILELEGGYVNDSHDPGGETKFGISKRAFPNISIADLSVEDAKSIYKAHYWDACHLDEVPSAIRLIIFDCAVNQGVTRATLFLQRTLGVVPDGKIGPKTIEAAKMCWPEEFIKLYAFMRFNAYAGNPNWNRYGKGWYKRLMHVQSESYMCIGTKAQGAKIQ